MNTNIKYYERKVPIVDTYSVKELEEIVKNSYSFKEVILKLGYKTQNGSNIKTVRNRLENLNIDYSHFASTMQIKRTYENVFCKNSTATQHVLRRWYKKISNDNICTICGQDKISNDITSAEWEILCIGFSGNRTCGTATYNPKYRNRFRY